MAFQPRIHENGNNCCSDYDARTGAPLPPSHPCDLCKPYLVTLGLRAAEETDVPHHGSHTYTPAPNPYAGDIARLRAAAGLSEHDRAVAEQVKLIEASAAETTALNDAAFRALAAEPVDHQYAPPNSYEAGLKARREARR